MDNPFSRDYLTAPLSEMATFGPYSTAFLVLMIGTIVVAAMAYFGLFDRFAADGVMRRAIRIAAQWIMWLCGIGLFFFAWRVMRIDFINLHVRVWTYLTMIAYLGSIAYFIYWRFRVYPRKTATRERTRELRRYMAPSASTPKSARRR